MSGTERDGAGRAGRRAEILKRLHALRGTLGEEAGNAEMNLRFVSDEVEGGLDMEGIEAARRRFLRSAEFFDAQHPVQAEAFRIIAKALEWPDESPEGDR